MTIKVWGNQRNKWESKAEWPHSSSSLSAAFCLQSLPGKVMMSDSFPEDKAQQDGNSLVVKVCNRWSRTWHSETRKRLKDALQGDKWYWEIWKCMYLKSEHLSRAAAKLLVAYKAAKSQRLPSTPGLTPRPVGQASTNWPWDQSPGIRDCGSPCLGQGLEIDGLEGPFQPWPLYDSESNLKSLSAPQNSTVSLSPLPICNVEAWALWDKNS